MEVWRPLWALSRPNGPAGTLSYFGGLPTGLPAAAWPQCGECGTAMTLLLQLAAGPWLPRIPSGHALLVFKCESDDVCDFWEPDEIANRCLLLPVSAGSSETAAPTATGAEPSRVLPQLWVQAWESDEDGISAEVADQLTDPDRFWDVPEHVSFGHGFASEHLTKAGGAPYWTGQGPSEDAPLPRRLLVQLDNWIALTDSAAAIADSPAGRDPLTTVSGQSVSAANFMSDGIAYVFDTTPDAPLPTPRLVINR